MASKDLAGDLSDTHKQENSRAAISPCCSARRGWNVRPQPSCESREGNDWGKGERGEREQRGGGRKGRRDGRKEGRGVTKNTEGSDLRKA